MTFIVFFTPGLLVSFSQSVYVVTEGGTEEVCAFIENGTIASGVMVTVNIARGDDPSKLYSLVKLGHLLNQARLDPLAIAPLTLEMRPPPLIRTL